MIESLAMSTAIRVTLQVAASLLLVLAVLAVMWRLPKKGEQLYGWAPPLALISAWTGLISLIATALLWFVPTPDRWLPAVFLVLYPGAIASGTLLLWIYRGSETDSDTIAAQRVQAWVGIVLGMIAVGIGYAFVMTHKTPFTPVGQ